MVPLPWDEPQKHFKCGRALYLSFSALRVQVDTVTVFSHGLHMHENGQRLQTRQFRSNSDGEEVMVHDAEVEYYSFLQAGFHIITNNNSVTIQVGGYFFFVFGRSPTSDLLWGGRIFSRMITLMYRMLTGRLLFCRGKVCYFPVDPCYGRGAHLTFSGALFLT